MNNVRTVSDTKRAFYSIHTRPINSIYRRVVEELMVEMHLLSVNVDFQYNPIYGLGVVTSFDRFMQGYRPDRDKESIFQALCQSLEADAQQYRQDAEWLQNMAANHSGEEMVELLSLSANPDMESDFQGILHAIANNPKFKYSRLFAVGLFTLLEKADPERVTNDQKRQEALHKMTKALNLPAEKIQKDLELYRSNLEKITQARLVMEDILAADRKKREEREQQKGAVTTPPSSPE
ncbi:photosystem II biogenesis protein Psp29 [Phormidium sp. CCY1219]|uniref:photosystem II biogenesis protein Psp29 n=1 Tax=Phormidium sp. CCY1219 TaxID=2886104 RepID=UPI002D1F0ED7|nr:photosystem II biogenesis protein Psp29 [Phormidium sp. CCY1219]MEB3827065.1 photosystem II biogenesis protein Psp29 [Phormidium sp. CCY1219]